MDIISALCVYMLDFMFNSLKFQYSLMSLKPVYFSSTPNAFEMLALRNSVHHVKR